MDLCASTQLQLIYLNALMTGMLVFLTVIIDIVYIDFSKAFDSIVFSKLLAKLEHYGIVDNLLEWISCFIKSAC